MSQENVDTVRRVFDATASRDGAALSLLYDPNVEWDASRSPSAELETRATGRDLEGFLRWFRQWHEAWESITYELEDVIDAGDRVVSVSTMRGRGRASGLDFEWPQFGVWTLRDAKIVRTEWFRTRQAALEAVGLRK